jgi:hypothetical protein
MLGGARMRVDLVAVKCSAERECECAVISEQCQRERGSNEQMHHGLPST